MARLKLLLLFLACAAPFVLAWMAYLFGWGQGSAGNYGELIQPAPLSGTPLDAARGKWILVTFDHAACDAYCEKKLYYLRQVRRATGKEMGRVERAWLLLDNGTPRAETLTAFEGTRLAPADASVQGKFPGDVADHIYLVDPLGNLMMRYPRDPDPAKMIKDLQRLLRASSIG